MSLASDRVLVDALAATNVPMLVTDCMAPGNPIIFANAAFLTMSGYALGEVLGNNPHFLNGPRTDPMIVHLFKTAITESRDEELEIEHYRKDGSTIWTALFVSQWRDEEGNTTHHFLSFLDVTRRRQTENALMRLAHDLETRIAARTKELAAANLRLSDLLRQNETLVNETNHRAKNSLQIASSILTVQACQETMPEVRSALGAAQVRLLAMARAHDLLSRSEQGRAVDLALYLGQICESLEAWGIRSDQVGIEVTIEGGLHVSADQAIPVGLIVNELITNAGKHAFPNLRGGTIVVRAFRADPERITIAVSDDGIGFAAGKRPGSLGLGLIRSLSDQLAGTLDVRSDSGTAVSVTFPG
jgi:PAS domain S-box-containing protein